MKPLTDKQLALITRRKAVWEGRLQGQTLQALADSHGVALGTIQNDLKAIAKDFESHVHTWRYLELERLEMLHSAVWANALNGDLAAIDRFIKLSERRSKLLGLDPPAKTLTVNLTPDQAKSLTDEELDAELKKRGLLP